jgi:hypothetical protein
MSPRIGLSRFARERHRPGMGRSTFQGAEDELIALAAARWHERRPGIGRKDTEKVVVIPVPPERFACATVLVGEDTPLEARLARRQPHEDPYIEVRAAAPAPRARYAALVLYSAATLLENGGERSGDFDWEIVSIQASIEADEPMHPLTMARNFLAKPGGTPCDYTARQFAEAIDYWSRRCGILPGKE